MPLTGEDLLKMGFKPGKTIGEIIAKLEVFWVKKILNVQKRMHKICSKIFTMMP